MIQTGVIDSKTHQPTSSCTGFVPTAISRTDSGGPVCPLTVYIIPIQFDTCAPGKFYDNEVLIFDEFTLFFDGAKKFFKKVKKSVDNTVDAVAKAAQAAAEDAARAAEEAAKQLAKLACDAGQALFVSAFNAAFVLAVYASLGISVPLGPACNLPKVKCNVGGLYEVGVDLCAETVAAMNGECIVLGGGPEDPATEFCMGAADAFGGVCTALWNKGVDQVRSSVGLDQVTLDNVRAQMVPQVRDFYQKNSPC